MGSHPADLEPEDLFGAHNKRFQAYTAESPYPLPPGAGDEQKGVALLRKERSERKKRKRVNLLQKEDGKQQPPSAAADNAAAGAVASGSQPDDQNDAPGEAKAIDRRALPQGWLECPRMGDLLYHHIPNLSPGSAPFFSLVAMKAPIGLEHPATAEIASQDQYFTPRDVILELKNRGLELRAVIDLTFGQYYSPDEFFSEGVHHEKIRCRGHGKDGWPKPADVNHFEAVVHALAIQFQSDPSSKRTSLPDCIAVHCTHGFNRSGFMLCNFIARHNPAGGGISAAFQSFRDARPPGIYKEEYKVELFRYWHERAPSAFESIERPVWKPAEDSDDDNSDNSDDEEGEGGEKGGDESSAKPPEHDDVIGEQVHPIMADFVRRCCNSMLGRDVVDDRFPGAQPVSLSRENIMLITERPYKITWKADGTRYLVLIRGPSVFLINRSYDVRRMQMRFPNPHDRLWLKHKPSHRDYLTHRCHYMTLLDGEMVVDKFEDPSKPGEFRYVRNLLIYDIVAANYESQGSLAARPFRERIDLVDRVIVGPRRFEKELFGKLTPPVYDYSKEGEDAFHVKRKKFFDLDEMTYLMKVYCKNLPHESDGLIFQGSADIYKPGTMNELLKWKSIDMNSVDFKYQHYDPETGKPMPRLFVMGKLSKPEVLEGEKVVFNNPEEARSMDGRIIECSLDVEKGFWVFMRERKDKLTANHRRVYEKVLQSIHDDIKLEDLADVIADSSANAAVGTGTAYFACFEARPPNKGVNLRLIKQTVLDSLSEGRFSNSALALHEHNPCLVPVPRLRLRKLPERCNRRVIECRYKGRTAEQGPEQDEWEFVAVTSRELPSSDAMYAEIVRGSTQSEEE